MQTSVGLFLVPRVYLLITLASSNGLVTRLTRTAYVQILNIHYSFTNRMYFPARGTAGPVRHQTYKMQKEKEEKIKRREGKKTHSATTRELGALLVQQQPIAVLDLVHVLVQEVSERGQGVAAAQVRRVVDHAPDPP